MANTWLRLWHDMPNDPKWRTIARASKQPLALVQAVYLHLLVDASRNVTRGVTSVTTEDLASALDAEEEQIEAILAAMQGRVLNGSVLSGWSHRQPAREDLGDQQTGAKSAAQRKREQREREKNQADETDCHDASRNVTTDKDTDTDTEEAITPIAPKGDSAQRKTSKFDPLTARPANVSAEAWASWCQHRKEIRKPLTATTCKQQESVLGDHPNPDDVIRQSIANGWTGLFPEKTHAPSSQHRPSGRPSAVDQVRGAIAARAAADAEAASGPARQALAEDDRAVRPPLDGEFRRVG